MVLLQLLHIWLLAQGSLADIYGGTTNNVVYWYRRSEEEQVISFSQPVFPSIQ